MVKIEKAGAVCCSLQPVVYHLQGLMRGRVPGGANKAAPQTRHRKWFESSAVWHRCKLPNGMEEERGGTIGDHTRIVI